MNTTSTRSVSSGLLVAPYQLNMWLGSFILIIGNISTIGNIIIFSSRAFRKRACTIYLLAEAIVIVFYLDLVLLTRVLQKGFQIPVLNQYDILCRLRYFASQYTNILAITLFVLASLDQLLSTHRLQAIRQWSGRVSLAYKLITACTIIWFAIACHRIVFYSTITGKCSARSGLYALIDNYFEAVINGFFPPIIVVLLGYSLKRSVQSTIERQIVPMNNEQNKCPAKLTFLKKTDKQLTQMLLWQTFVAFPTYLPYTCELIYDNVTEKWSKSSEWVAWETVCIETIRLISYTFFSTRLYVTLASSQGIRQQIFEVFKLRRNVHPISDRTNTIDVTNASKFVRNT